MNTRSRMADSFEGIGHGRGRPGIRTVARTQPPWARPASRQSKSRTLRAHGQLPPAQGTTSEMGQREPTSAHKPELIAMAAPASRNQVMTQSLALQLKNHNPPGGPRDRGRGRVHRQRARESRPEIPRGPSSTSRVRSGPPGRGHPTAAVISDRALTNVSMSSGVVNGPGLRRRVPIGESPQAAMDIRGRMKTRPDGDVEAGVEDGGDVLRRERIGDDQREGAHMGLRVPPTATCQPSASCAQSTTRCSSSTSWRHN